MSTTATPAPASKLCIWEGAYMTGAPASARYVAFTMHIQIVSFSLYAAIKMQFYTLVHLQWFLYPPFVSLRQMFFLN